MDRATLWHYPVVGYSTRYMSQTTIGKYGVGAKLAALNFGKRMIDVWSRQSETQPWLHVHFDLDDAIEAERDEDDAGVGIAEPVRDLPEKDLPIADQRDIAIVWRGPYRFHHQIPRCDGHASWPWLRHSRTSPL